MLTHLPPHLMVMGSGYKHAECMTLLLKHGTPCLTDGLHGVGVIREEAQRGRRQRAVRTKNAVQQR